MARVQSVDYKAIFVFLGDANAHHSEHCRSRSLLLIGMDTRGNLLIFCNLSGFELLVHCSAHIAGSRLDLVITDVSFIVDVFVGTPLGSSDHCFLSCVHHVEQSVPEYNV